MIHKNKKIHVDVEYIINNACQCICECDQML